MNTVAGTLQFLSAVSVGLYAGAMLTEGSVLVPYWRSAPAPEFFSWYAANGGRLQGFFGAVTWAAGLFAIAAALAALWAGRPGRWSAVLAAVLMAAAVSSFSSTSREPTRASLAAPRARPSCRWSWPDGRRGTGRAPLPVAEPSLPACCR